MTGDACDNEDAGGDEDDDGENFEDRDAEWVSGDEIKNISEEEAGLEDASENTLSDEDTGEDEIKNTSEEEPGFEDASEDALDDEDIGEDEIKNISGEGAGFKGASEDTLADEEIGEDDDDDDSKNSDTSHDPEISEVTREEAEVKWVIRNAVDEGEMRKQDEAPKKGRTSRKSYLQRLTSRMILKTMAALWRMKENTSSRRKGSWTPRR